MRSTDLLRFLLVFAAAGFLDLGSIDQRIRGARRGYAGQLSPDQGTLPPRKPGESATDLWNAFAQSAFTTMPQRCGMWAGPDPRPKTLVRFGKVSLSRGCHPHPDRKSTRLNSRHTH